MAERRYLSTLVSHLRGEDAADARQAEYLGLLDRALEDRVVTREEASELAVTALEWGLSRQQVETSHAVYLGGLAAQALADGVVTDAERRDLVLVAELLGLTGRDVDQALREAEAAGPGHATSRPSLAGLSVCFTGELLSSIGGEPITRDRAHELAARAGLDVRKSVTKKLDLLVVADPASASGKARKARECGTRVMAEGAFWAALGVQVE